MKKRYRLTLNLQTFNEESSVELDTGVDSVPAAEEQTTEQTTQTEDKTDVAFAKRLAAKEKEWQAQKEREIQALEDRFKDFDVYKQATEYLQKSSGINDIMTLKEELEMQKLQERSEQENLPPEVLKRLDELEAKAKRAEELEEQQTQAKQIEEFETSLKTFCEGKEIDGKPIDYKELWGFMSENQIGNVDIAYKAMKADILESKLAEAEKAGVKKYLASKQGTKVDSGGGSIVMDKGKHSAREKLEAALRASQQ